VWTTLLDDLGFALYNTTRKIKPFLKGF